MLQPVHVAHDGFGQVGQVALAKVAQRQLPQPLCQAQASCLHLTVHQTVGGFVLLNVGSQGKNDEGQHQ